jgi:DNA-binding NarL/FixJ family response regulator
MHVLIVDDHTIIRRGIRNLLTQRYPDVRVSDAGSIRETRKILNSEQPCLMILDLLLSDGNAMDHLDEWRELRPGTKVLVYSMTSEMLYARRVIGLGCSGFLSKDTPEEELIKAINTIYHGQVYVSDTLAPYYRNGRFEEGGDDPFNQLSDREIRVAQDIVSGFGIKEISQRLNISPSTVATYKSRLFDKLGATTELELQRLAEIHRFATS